MRALYTETFKEFLSNNATSDELVALIFKIEQNLPGFSFVVEEHGGATTVLISFFTIMKNKFEYREIGYETEDLFFSALNRKTDEIIIKYKQKIDMVVSKYPNLLDHKIDITEVENYYGYLNPSVATTPNLNTNSVFKRQRDHQQMTGISTNDVELLAQFQEIKSIYYEAIESFEPCFMGCF